MRETW